MKTSRTFLDYRLFRKRCESGKAPSEALLRKPAKSGLTLTANGDRQFGFIFSDGSVDRHGDTVSPKGWSLDNFTKGGGPLLWAHQYDTPPLGKVTGVSTAGDALKGTVQFTPEGMSDFNDMIYKMVSGGFLSATSVGFSPTDYTFNEERGGIDFLAQELMEVSVVPVPANPNALIEARSAGIDLTELSEWVNKSLYWMQSDSLMIPVSTLEHAADVLGIKMATWSAPEEVFMAEIATKEIEVEEASAEDELLDEDEAEIKHLKKELEAANAKLAELEDDEEYIEFEDSPEESADIDDAKLKELVSQTLAEVFGPALSKFTKATGQIIDLNTERTANTHEDE